jgi:hypothetical protein
MFQLAVVALSGDEVPAIVGQPAQQVSDFHQQLPDPFTVSQL